MVLILPKPPVSQILTCRSLILLNPVVANLSRSPIQAIRAPLMPPCPSVMRTASPPVRGSNILIFRSLQVVASRVPLGLNARLWITSLCPVKVAFGRSVLARSHNLMVCSPDALASTLEALGWNRTWPILRGDASMRATGSKSYGTQCSWPHPSNWESSTFQIITFPSSPPEATMESLWGDQSVSRTGAVWLLANGITSGSLYGRLYGNALNGDGKGRMAKAPPPDAFQLTLMYFCSDYLCEQPLNTKHSLQRPKWHWYPRRCSTPWHFLYHVLFLRFVRRRGWVNPISQFGGVLSLLRRLTDRYLEARTKRDMGVLEWPAWDGRKSQIRSYYVRKSITLYMRTVTRSGYEVGSIANLNFPSRHCTSTPSPC